MALLEHEARARETKDVYWAYGMEQRLNTFILQEAIDDSDSGLGQRLETGMSITGAVVELDAIATRRR